MFASGHNLEHQVHLHPKTELIHNDESLIFAKGLNSTYELSVQPDTDAIHNPLSTFAS